MMIYLFGAVLVGLGSGSDLFPLPVEPPACSEQIIASANGVLQAIYDCSATGTSSQVCLSQFIGSYQTDYPITNGPCREAYQDLFDALAPIYLFCYESGFAIGDALCWMYNHMFLLIVDFYGKTNFFPDYPGCQFSAIRALANQEAYKAIVLNTVGPQPQPSIDFVYDTKPDCAFCYAMFDYQIGYIAQYLDDANVAVNCAEDPLGTACLGSTSMIDSRHVFQQCSGFDILETRPPGCDEFKGLIAHIMPKPYYAYVFCSYHPLASFCATVDTAYWTPSIASNACSLCLTEFYNNVKQQVEQGLTYCSTDVYSDACVAFNSNAIELFAECSGFELDLVPN